MLHVLGVLLFSSSLGFALKKQHANANKLAVQSDENLGTPLAAPQNTAVVAPAKAQQALIEQDEEAKATQHYLQVSGLGLGLTAVGHLWYAPLGVLSLPLLGYCAAVLFHDAYEGLRQKKLRISVLDSMAISVGIASGLYALSAVANLIYFASLKILHQTRHQTQKNFVDIFSGHPPSVWLLQEGVEIAVPLAQVCKGDRIVVNAGETVAIDGVIETGIASIDQHMLTGEAQPEEKTVGQSVFAATLLIAGRIVVRVEKTGRDTLAAQVTEVLSNTDDFISALQTRGETLANESVVPTFGVAGVALAATGPTAMAVVLSSNFSEVMRFSVPLSMLNYLHIAAKAGLLIKDGRSLEQLPQVDTVVFDKTGTLTQEQPQVGKIYTHQGFSEKEVLYYTAAVEYRQSHPIAKAILQAAAQQALSLPQIDDAHYSMGYGIRAQVDGHRVRVGSLRFMQHEQMEIPTQFGEIEQYAHEQGYSLIYTALDDRLCGLIELHPALRPEVSEVIQALQQRNLDVYILSGDHEIPVKNLAEQLGVDYFAETLPQDKARVIETLQRSGKTVCFVGDGINDAIALKTAAVSISLQGASNVATDSAQIVLMQQNLAQILRAFQIADEFNANQKLGVNLGILAPSTICMGGAILFGFTIANTLLFYCSSALVGVGAAMLPLVKEHIKIPTQSKD